MIGPPGRKRSLFVLSPKLMVLSRFVKHLRGPGLPMPTKKEAMAVLREILDTGKITPVIDSTYNLSDVREALRHLIEDELQGT